MNFPVGVSDFKELIQYKNPVTNEGYLFVDKSLCIKEVALDGSKVVVITRPRRFGKTINLSMLSYFYNIEHADENRLLFDGLNISKEKSLIEKEQGKYPVIFVSFKGIKSKSFEDAKNKISMLFSTLFDKYIFLLDSSDVTPTSKEQFRKVLSREVDDVLSSSSLLLLSDMLKSHYKTPVMMLIDEYDTPIHGAYINGYYDEMVSFMRSILGESLKDNSNIHKAVLTGILRVSKESIFSGLNNVKVRSILSNQYADSFGFLESEVDDFLSRSKINYSIQDVQQWYNGYIFGDRTLYNPWSIINFADNQGVLDLYWVNTSDNGIVKEMLTAGTSQANEKVKKLLQGEPITEYIGDHVSFKDLGGSKDLSWSMLLMSGYLKPVKLEMTPGYKKCELKIPNKEVAVLYREIIYEWLSQRAGLSWYHEMMEHLVKGEVDDFCENVKNLLNDMVSFHDAGTHRGEVFYHGLTLGLVAGLNELYYVRSNRESGEGRYDIAMFPRDKSHSGVIFELKVSANDTALVSDAKKALQQIDALNYESELQAQGVEKIIKIGISFSGKHLDWQWSS